MDCEAYILNDGSYQCGNCGNVHQCAPQICDKCGSKVIAIVDEGESQESEAEEA